MEPVLTFDLEGLDGVKKRYTLKPILRREAAWVFNQVLRAATKAIASSVDLVLSAISGPGGIRQADMSKLITALAPLDQIPFDDMWETARLLFTGSMVSSLSDKPVFMGTCNFRIDDFNSAGADYFREHPFELYIALIKAIDANWPSVFSAARDKIVDLFQKLKKKSEESTESNGLPQTNTSKVSG